jgi:hypothetical protein
MKMWCVGNHNIPHVVQSFHNKWYTPKILERLKCEFENENNERKKSWDTFPNSQHFKVWGVLEFWNGD